MAIRQPIVTVAGHVDHGKTSLLDRIRGSSVAETEAGRITQKISFTLFPAESIKKGCWLIDKYSIPLKIPGFLFIDTPGHAAFTNLRKRGGSLADLAILVIDINEGIMPQTAEVISILKANKTPFIVALNKIDAISGWRKQDEELKDSIDKQASRTKQDFEEKFYTIVGALDAHGFNADLFFNIPDFTKKLALIPCSAKTGEGIPELLMVLCGLSQRFLSDKLSLGEDAKGVVLEIKKEKTMQNIEVVLYDGRLKEGSEIAIATFQEPIISKIRAMQEVLPLSSQFRNAKEAKAATGLRLQLTGRAEILPGMPFCVYKGNIEQIKKEFKKEIAENIKTDKEGVIVKAESLGSVEALLKLLRQENISIGKAGIGNISKNDISAATANLELIPLDAVIIGFNVALDEEIKEKGIKIDKRVGILTGDIIYGLIDRLKEFREQRRKEAEREKMLGLARICKLEILHNYVFRNAKPAIFGIKVLHGKLNPHVNLITADNEQIGKVKAIQLQNEPVHEAERNMEAAISIPGVTFDRQLKDERFLYSDITEAQFREFKKNRELLTGDEISCLQEISDLKRKQKATWGI